MRAIPRTYSSRPVRRGLSFVEFIGCLVAMIGGVFIGSAYLGIDVKDMAIGVLAKADVIKPEFLQDDKESTSTQADSDSPQSDAQASTTSDTGEVVEDVIVAEANTPEQPGASSETNNGSQTKRVPEPTDAERQAATRAYWDALTACILTEASNRSEGFNAAEDWQLFDYLVSRKEGHEQALESLNQLDEFGVDERLLAHGRQVANWNASAVKLFERALALLTDGPGAGITGPFAQTWQSSATQLRMEEALIVDKHNAVASYLDHEYAQIAPFQAAFKK